MKKTWKTTGLLLAALGIAPVMSVWAQPPHGPDGSPPSDQDKTRGGRDSGSPENDHPSGPASHGRGNGGGPRGDEGMCQACGGPGHGGGPGRNGDQNRNGGPNGSERRDDSFGAPGRGGPRGRGGGNFRPGGDDRGRGGSRDGGPRDWHRDDWNNRDGNKNNTSDTTKTNATGANVGKLTLSGTITLIIVDDSIGVRGDDGKGYWVRVPKSSATALRVGQRIELSGQWQDQYFVAQSVRVR